MEDSIKMYVNIMASIKYRIDTIKTMGMSPFVDIIHGEIQLESIYLQFRKILEMFAMASLVSNKRSYASARSEFHKDWNAGKILRGIKKLNPRYYPQAIVERPQPDGAVDLTPRTDALTEEEFTRLYDQRCGAILHTANPFASPLDYKKFLAEVTPWLVKIINLLNKHKITLAGESRFWLIQMGAAGQPVTYHRFELAPD